MRKKVKRTKAKGERPEEEVAETTRPGGEEKPMAEEPREGVEEAREEAREAAAEIPQEEAAPEERPSFKDTILTQCMKDPSFRTRVIYHLVEKLR